MRSHPRNIGRCRSRPVVRRSVSSPWAAARVVGRSRLTGRVVQNTKYEDSSYAVPGGALE
eukprot:scaffold128107_cov18-Tisochrysis_lutea.AAC.1